jgi:glutamate/tyrosine decarboxylase-like PLP-dependent enzyme
VETTLEATRWLAAEVTRRDGFTLLLEPQLSVTVFRVDGWDESRYAAWSTSRARAGLALVLPTTWNGERCYRVCIVNPLTTHEMLAEILDDMTDFGPG